MFTEKMPEGFPLEPKDFEGNLIQEGDAVKILSIPESLLLENVAPRLRTNLTA